MPERIQLSRAKGWRKPENTIVVARPSIFGNPWRVDMWSGDLAKRRQHAVNVFRDNLERALAGDLHTGWQIDRIARELPRLAGHDLACWCPLDGHPCHADVLLELANREPA